MARRRSRSSDRLIACEREYYRNREHEFRRGFKGCVEMMMECRGMDKEDARRLCWYIVHHRAGRPS